VTRILIRGGTVLDATGQRRADVTIDGGRVVEVGPKLTASDGDEQILEADGCIVSPGFVDLHVHLREPGREEAETIETGSRAAALGGFTAIVAMPNTEPAQDSLAVVEFVRAQSRRAALCDVHPAGCITINREGRALAPFGELAAAGVHLFTDDGSGVQDPQLMRHALEYARVLDITLAQHCEVSSLTKGAVMHEGSCCSHLGLPGWPAIAEELMVHRDIELSRLTGARIHLLHLSTARSVELVRAAKADGLPVTAEAAPHHFTLTHDLLVGYDAVYKVNPPLRTDADVQALRAGLADGTIDVVGTDHAPHPSEHKECEWAQAAMGMTGLETALSVVQHTMIETGLMSWADFARVTSAAAAKIGRLEDQGRPLEAGEPANIILVDPAARWTVEPAKMATMGRNSPFKGMELPGKVVATFFKGHPTVLDGKLNTPYPHAASVGAA
jgi:dihydroorotase